MNPTKLLIGQIVIVFAVIVFGVWAATQWCADMLDYQARLGPPWHVLFGWPIYEPWKFFDWWYRYEAYAPYVFDKAGMLAGASGFIGCAAAIIGSLWRARQGRLVTTYGSSRWATTNEVRRAGLFCVPGVFLGRLNDAYLRHDGPEHVMAFAPTRSGKGVGLVVPTLLSWTGSAVIHDIKGENWQLTGGWRSQFSHALLFNPTDSRSARYNPLLEVRKGSDEVRDVQNIADILVDPEGALERRNHWEKTSHSLLVGTILHILYAEEEKTLSRVAAFLSDPMRSFDNTLRCMMTTNHIGTEENPQVHPVVASAALALVMATPAYAAGAGMPWEEPLQQILDSVQGPVAKIIAVIIIIVTGLTLAFGETSGGFRRLIQIVFGLSIAFAASSFFLSFFSFGGGALV
jgi:type IV secretion system protein VirD4